MKPARATPSQAHISADARFWRLTAVFVLPLLICDVTVVRLMAVIQQSDYAAVIVYACFRLIGAQGVVLAAAQVLGPGSIVRRTILTWGFGALVIGGGGSLLRS